MPGGIEQTSLDALIQACVIELRAVDGTSRGTAFFVADGLALTCQHVVQPDGDSPPEFEARGADLTADPVPAHVYRLSARPYPDLALVKVEIAPGHPCVLMDKSPIARDMDFFAAGFPASEIAGYQAPSFATNGLAKRPDGKPIIDLKQGMANHGLSGAPLVNRNLFAVSGILNYSKNPDTDLGAWAVPIQTALDAFPELVAFHDRPPAGARLWLDALGDQHRLLMGRQADGSVKSEMPSPSVLFEISLSGSFREWTVTARTGTDGTEAKTVAVGVNEYEEDLPDALGSWARRRPLSGPEDVAQLGRLLGRALLPRAIGQELAACLGSPAPVNIRIETDARLADLPWEYVRDGGGTYIAADERFVFSRKAGSARTLPAQRAANVLPVVVCPDQFHRRLPWTWNGWTGKRERAPEAADLATAIPVGLAEAITTGSVSRRSVLVNPAAEEFVTAVQDRQPDIIHYVGFAKGNQLGFWGEDDDMYWVPFSRLLDTFGGRGRHLVVLQFCTFPPDEPADALDPAEVLGLLNQNVCAVVLTNHPGPAPIISQFNVTFYDQLRNGASVEEAGQAARVQLQQRKPLSDHTAFGIFSVYTSAEGDVRILATPAGRDMEVRKLAPGPISSPSYAPLRDRASNL